MSNEFGAACKWATTRWAEPSICLHFRIRKTQIHGFGCEMTRPVLKLMNFIQVGKVPLLCGWLIAAISFIPFNRLQRCHVRCSCWEQVKAIAGSKRLGHRVGQRHVDSMESFHVGRRVSSAGRVPHLPIDQCLSLRSRDLRRWPLIIRRVSVDFFFRSVRWVLDSSTVSTVSTRSAV